MSVSEFATVILMLCGKGNSEAHFDCYDYFNNCVINKSVDISIKNVEQCKSDYKNGILKIQKAKE